MREIKCRAWDSRNKRMIYDVIVSSQMLLIPVTKMHGELFGIDGNEYVQVSRSAYVVMQWAGLKDKKGLDIYEGDIDADGRVICFDQPQAKYKVVAIDLYKQNAGNGGWTGLGLHRDYIDLIGNVHENPDLLE